jgi:hypothetical protein
MNRRSFMQKASCISGACLCGFSSFAISAKTNNNETSLLSKKDEEEPLALVQEYLGMLLINLQQDNSRKQNRKTIKQLSQIHYRQLKMDEMLKPFENNLNGFINFLEKEWGWKLNYSTDHQLLIADENKNYCVCPMINHKTGIKSGALCYCSEGFAEQMFSKIVGHPVKAKVIASIQRGDTSCKYQVDLS